MSNVIRFLESIGGNPAQTGFSSAGYQSVVASLDVDFADRQALLDRDAKALNALLGGRPKMYCAQYPAKENRPLKREQEQEQEQEEREEEVPEDESKPET